MTVMQIAEMILLFLNIFFTKNEREILTQVAKMILLFLDSFSKKMRKRFLN